MEEPPPWRLTKVFDGGVDPISSEFLSPIYSFLPIRVTAYFVSHEEISLGKLSCCMKV